MRAAFTSLIFIFPQFSMIRPFSIGTRNIILKIPVNSRSKCQPPSRCPPSLSLLVCILLVLPLVLLVAFAASLVGLDRRVTPKKGLGFSRRDLVHMAPVLPSLSEF
jgi:hypothetical protein